MSAFLKLIQLRGNEYKHTFGYSWWFHIDLFCFSKFCRMKASKARLWGQRSTHSNLSEVGQPVMFFFDVHLTLLIINFKIVIIFCLCVSVFYFKLKNAAERQKSTELQSWSTPPFAGLGVLHVLINRFIAYKLKLHFPWVAATRAYSAYRLSRHIVLKL